MGFNKIIKMKKLFRPIIRYFCQKPSKSDTAFVQKTVRVAILGANSSTGQALALLVKQNPLVSHLYLHDITNTAIMAADLKTIDTRCDVSGYGEQDINKAIRSAEIIVLLGLDTSHRDSTAEDRLRAEGYRLLKLAKAACTFSPRAILVDCVAPLSITLPLISEVYRNNHWYHPGRVVGSVALLQIRFNTLLANHQNLNPSSVNVPLLGGPDFETIIPLFTRATPSPMPIAESKVMINRFRGFDDDARPTKLPKSRFEYAPTSNGFAINRLVTTIALGLLGDNAAFSTAFVRSNFATACRHLVSTVKFGAAGVAHNYGVPRLTKFELRMFERVCLELGKREDFARSYYEAGMKQQSSSLAFGDADIQQKVLFPPEAPQDLHD